MHHDCTERGTFHGIEAPEKGHPSPTELISSFRTFATKEVRGEVNGRTGTQGCRRDPSGSSDYEQRDREGGFGSVVQKVCAEGRNLERTRTEAKRSSARSLEYA